MATANTNNLPQLTELCGKIARELVFAEPGKDTGLLPVNNLLSQIEELCAAAPPPQPVPQAVAMARKCVDYIFESTGLFDPATLKWLADWINWMELA